MRILVIGAGDIGFHLCKRLCFDQHDITLVEMSPKKVQRAQEQLDALIIEGNGASYSDLRRANIQQMTLVAAMTDNDEVNLMACRIAKKCGVPVTIARVRNAEYTNADFILNGEELGADHIIHPEQETAKAFVRLIHQSSATYAFEFEEGRIQVLGVHLEPGSPLLNTPLIQLDGYNDAHLRIVAVERNHQTLIPDGRTILRAGDQVFAVCDHHYVSEFLSLAGKQNRPAANVMILGGGLVGRNIAAELASQAYVKIVESDERRARLVAELLPNALVIHAEGSDLDLLKNEGLAEMDVFVAVTGNDEYNIISTLLARHLQVPQSIALVNKVEYLAVPPTIGIHSVVSQQLMVVNLVQHLIQSQVADMATPPGLDAQLIEFIATPRSKITRNQLRNVGFPKDAIVGAVLRGNQVLIPHGDTQIIPGDRAVIFTLPQAMSKIERLFGR
ncbi:MAG: Trk system potassium transporter TrkA [Caldilineaceae bacterium]